MGGVTCYILPSPIALLAEPDRHNYNNAELPLVLLPISPVASGLPSPGSGGVADTVCPGEFHSSEILNK